MRTGQVADQAGQGTRRLAVDKISDLDQRIAHLHAMRQSLQQLVRPATAHADSGNARCWTRSTTRRHPTANGERHEHR